MMLLYLGLNKVFPMFYPFSPVCLQELPAKKGIVRVHLKNIL
jgi:hypothetical protein